MGFFDGLIKSVAKNVAKNAVTKAVSDGIDKAVDAVQDAVKENRQNSAQPQTTTTSAPSCMMGTSGVATCKEFDLSAVDTSSIGTKEMHFITYDCSGDTDKEIDNRLMLEKGYHEFDSGAAEIFFCASYNPELPEDEYGKYSKSTPYIFVGNLDRNGVAVIDEFEKHATIKQGCEISMGTQGKYLYKIAYYYPGQKITCYCYKEEPENNFYSCIGVTYPQSMSGTADEEKFRKHLDVAAVTFESTVKN